MDKKPSGVRFFLITALVLHAVCLPLVLFYTKIPITPFVIPLFYAFAPITLGMAILYRINVLRKERLKALLYIAWAADCLMFSALFIIRREGFANAMVAQGIGWAFILGNYAIFYVVSGLYNNLPYGFMFVCGTVFPIGLITIAVCARKENKEFRKNRQNGYGVKSSGSYGGTSSESKSYSSSSSSSRREMYDGNRSSGYMEDNKIYDSSNRQTGTVINSRVYDENMNPIGFIDDDKYHPY